MIHSTHSLSVIRLGMQGTVLSSGMEDFFGECESAYPPSIHPSTVCAYVCTRDCAYSLRRVCVRVLPKIPRLVSTRGLSRTASVLATGSRSRAARTRTSTRTCRRLAPSSFSKSRPSRLAVRLFHCQPNTTSCGPAAFCNRNPFAPDRIHSHRVLIHCRMLSACLSVCVAWLVRGS